MEITEEQMPPVSQPPVPEKGFPTDKPDKGPRPDTINPEQSEEGTEPVDPIPDMDPPGQDPEGEAVNERVKIAPLAVEALPRLRIAIFELTH
jgi:hypothetical protein